MNTTDPSDFVARLHESLLEARDLRLLTDLSSRQIGDWDRRGVLPNSRDDPAGWRRFSGWDAIAISIVSTLREQFGIPLNKQEHLLWWMLGALPTQREQLRQHLSEMVLSGQSDGLPAPYDRLVTATVYGATFGNLDPILLRFPDSASVREHHPAESHDAERMSVLQDSMVPRLAHTLAARGWPAKGAAEFARRFLRLSFGSKTGTGTYPELQALRSKAVSMNDPQAVRATLILSQALLPLSETFAIMTAGFPVVLLTDLKKSVFVDSFRHTELTSTGRLAPTTISMRVDTIVANVLEHIGGAKPVIDLDPAAATVTRLRDGRNEIIRLLDVGDFTQMVIERREAEYRVITQNPVTVGLDTKIRDLIRGNEFKTVTIGIQDGSIIRSTEETSTKLPQSVTGTTRAADGR